MYLYPRPNDSLAPSTARLAGKSRDSAPDREPVGSQTEPLNGACRIDALAFTTFASHLDAEPYRPISLVTTLEFYDTR